MKTRCYNEKSHDYARFGRLGVGVCLRWTESFAVFLSDVGEPPTPSHSLSLIDDSIGFEPGNVEWVDRLEALRRSIEFSEKKKKENVW